MSTSWIKVEVTTSQKVEILTISELLKIDPHTVLGKLIVLWCWADINTIDGHAKGVTKVAIDSVVGHKGFADAMLSSQVGWLNDDGSGNLFFSNFDRHNGKGAKKRSLDARRAVLHRKNIAQESRNERDGVTTKKPTRSEKDKREIREVNNTSMKKNSNFHPDTDSVIDYLNQKTNGKFKKSNASRDPISGRLNDGYTKNDCFLVIDYKASEWLHNIKMAEFLRPITLFAPTKFPGYLTAASRVKTNTHFTDDEIL